VPAHTALCAGSILAGWIFGKHKKNPGKNAAKFSRGHYWTTMSAGCVGNWWGGDRVAPGRAGNWWGGDGVRGRACWELMGR
jgi:hypothetical protein